MSIYNILLIIIGHYIADFVLQNEKIAINKSKNSNVLFNHAVYYSSAWFIILLFNNIDIDLFKILIFVIITFIFHFSTDFISSRITSRLFKKKIFYTNIPNFGAFSIIGLDQVFHYVQLFLTFKLIYN